MTDYAALLAAIHRVFPACRLEPVAEPELAAIRRQFPDVPGHYLEFLRHVERTTDRDDVGRAAFP